MVINCMVEHQALDISEIQAVEKSQEYLRCHFVFATEDWEGTAKTAYFKNGKYGEVYSQILDAEGDCIIPHEALAYEATVYFSVAGVSGDYRITSSIASFYNDATVYGGAASQPPTPDVYEQLLTAMQGKVDIDQGAGNAGKFLGVGEDGRLNPMDPPGGGAGGGTYKPGENIEITEDGTINVLTTNEAEQDNTKPITSAGVFTVVGNIEAILKTI